MNCIAIKRTPALLLLAWFTALGGPVASALDGDESLAYSVRYRVATIPDTDSLQVSMTVQQTRGLLREVRFKVSPHLSDIRVDGDSLGSLDEVSWLPGPSGGTLSWIVEIGNERNGNGYDAWIESDWGVFRAEDVIPRAATRAVRGAYSKTTLQIDLPRDWTAVTAYPLLENTFSIDKEYRNFDQPDGWIAIGRLGVRREQIAGMRVTVAGPVGHSVGRMEILAVLNWTLPELSRALGDLPERLTIISAGEPMWRGGLSGPNSFFLHADRPLISENSTSPLLHEVMHSILRISAADGFDWLVEGIAEYYSLKLLHRSGSISESRYQKAMNFQKNWSSSADSLCKSSSTGATTALAVVTMSALDAEIRSRSSGNASLDDVVVALRKNPRQITLGDVQSITEDITGSKSVILQLDKLPGCRTINSIAQETS
ncbi:MAG: hypothetical protein ACR2QL_11550 [Woeseiaceae bacterium]